MSNRCNKCGTVVDSPFCPNCGTPTQQPVNDQTAQQIPPQQIPPQQIPPQQIPPQQIPPQQIPPQQTYHSLYSQNQPESNSNMQQPPEKKQGCLFLGIVICSIIIFLLLFSVLVTGCIVSLRNSYNQSADKAKNSSAGANARVEDSTGDIPSETEIAADTPEITPAVTPAITSAVNPETPQAKAPEEEYLTEDEIQALYSEPGKYKGRRVRISGVVFDFPKTDEIGIYFQLLQNASGHERGSYVEYYGELNVKRGDYIVVEGEVEDEYKGLTLFGNAYIPTIISDHIEMSTYQEAVSPTEKEVDVNKAQEQHGYEIKVEKIEFSPIETRIYITINNDGNSELHVYPHNMRILQGRSQYEYQNNLDASYPKLQTELLPGASTSGVVRFPVISQTDDFKLYIEGSSQNWKEKMEDYIFDISVK